MVTKQVAGCLREYGSALRGSWGGIDGRSEQAVLQDLADAIEAPEKYELAWMRRNLDICPAGNGHWIEFCDKECEAANV